MWRNTQSPNAVRQNADARPIPLAVALTTLLLGSLLPVHLCAQGGIVNNPEHWNVRMMGEDQYKHEKGIVLSIGQGSIIIRTSNKKKTLSIKTAHVTDISESIIKGSARDRYFAEDEALLGLPGPRSAGFLDNCSVCSDPVAGGSAVALFIAADFVGSGVVGLMSLRKFEDHFIKIDWLEDGNEDKSITVKVDKGDSDALIHALRDACPHLDIESLPSNEISRNEARDILLGRPKPSSTGSNLSPSDDGDVKTSSSLPVKYSQRAVSLDLICSSPFEVVDWHCEILAPTSKDYSGHCEQPAKLR